MPTAAVVASGEPEQRRDSVTERLGRAWREMRRGAAAEALGERLYGRPGDVNSIDPAHFDVLDVLSRRDGRRMSELAAALHIDPSSATRTMHRMESAGLARRAPTVYDGRVVTAHITDEGRRLHALVAARRSMVIGAALQELTPDDRERLVDLLERFVVALGRDATAVGNAAG